MLVALLKKLSKFHFSGEADSEAGVSTAKGKVAKRCLTEVLGIIKVLLIGSFCAKEADGGLALQLERKLSSCNATEENEN